MPHGWGAGYKLLPHQSRRLEALRHRNRHWGYPTARQSLVRAGYRHRLRRRPLRGDGLEKRSEEHTSELQSRFDLVCRLLLEKKKKTKEETVYRGIDDSSRL